MNVCTPVLEVKVPILVIPPLKVGVMAALSDQEPPEFIVTNPVKVLTGLVALEKIRVPEVPPPIIVVPVTVKECPAFVNVVPSPIFKFPPIVNPTTVAVVAVPEVVKFPAIDVTPAINVLAPDVESLR